MIAIIDYDAGNLRSVEKAFVYLGQEVIVTRNKETILNADKVVLPGVGAFKEAMEKLHKYDLVDTIKEVVRQKKPFLGICLGLQLLFDYSEEGEGERGLGILPGKILRIPDKKGLKIPHIGWNDIEIKEDCPIFKELKQHSYVYFVHSYYLKAEVESDVAATTHYSTLIHAAIQHENVFACQFHPEKSGEVGLHILRNFANL
ncbi:imidazole glycerol phosphate synthase amidotransferase subunit [Lachnospiraceae bacterium KM106-2]|nr:imidazole glycerol phosphate synthase amidotransferase subunit [Lachnospiraceae bacterium KM106-2]